MSSEMLSIGKIWTENLEYPVFFLIRKFWSAKLF